MFSLISLNLNLDNFSSQVWTNRYRCLSPFFHQITKIIFIYHETFETCYQCDRFIPRNALDLNIQFRQFSLSYVRMLTRKLNRISWICFCLDSTENFIPRDFFNFFFTLSKNTFMQMRIQLYHISPPEYQNKIDFERGSSG